MANDQVEHYLLMKVLCLALHYNKDKYDKKKILTNTSQNN
jgi:hypothetical protein